MPQLTRPAPRTLSNSFGQASVTDDQMSEIRSQRSHVSTTGSRQVSSMTDIRVGQAARAFRDTAASFRASVSDVLETVSTLPATVRARTKTVRGLPALSAVFRRLSAAFRRLSAAFARPSKALGRQPLAPLFAKTLINTTK
jgi:uncharacterized protein YukE